MNELQSISIDDAMNLSGCKKDRHLLLGNGFSMNWSKRAFSYASLMKGAEKYLGKAQKEAFRNTGSQNFEQAIQWLRDHGSQSEADELRNILTIVVDHLHPRRRKDISTRRFHRCKKFLAQFGKYFSLNYDLLLYWTLVPEAEQLKSIDRYYNPRIQDFRSRTALWPQSSPENLDGMARDSIDLDVHYLHGALHIFDNWNVMEQLDEQLDGNIASMTLPDKVRTALKEKYYPVIITEGTASAKLNRIRQNRYLEYCFRRFSTISGWLFTYGVSFAENDRHIIDAIIKNRMLKGAIIGYYEDKDKKRAGEVFSGNISYPVYCYPTSDVVVWG